MDNQPQVLVSNNSIPSAPPNPPNPSPSSLSSTPKIRWLIIIGIILLFITLTPAGLFLFQSLSLRKETSQQQDVPPTSFPTIQITATPIIVKEKPSVELYMDIKNQLIQVFKSP